MKFNLFLSAAMSLLFFASCTKEGISTVTPVTPPAPVPVTANTWKLGSAEFTSLYTFRLKPSSSDTALTGWDRTFTAGLDFNTINSWYISFKTFPVANATFRVVAYPSSGTLTSNTDVYITAKSAGAATAYVSTGVGAIDVTATFTGGKITIVVPSIPMTNGTTTTTFSGTLKEL